MKLPDVSVPPGLVDAWNKVLRFFVSDTITTVIVKVPPTRNKNGRLRKISLFNLWKPLWATFGSAQRTAWQNYWGTLPFGSHAGADFYPGSGYSAFVYVNAPRYKAGLDLLLWPESNNLVFNPAFASAHDGWTFTNGSFVGSRAVFVPLSACTLFAHETPPPSGVLSAGNYSLSLFVGPGAGKVRYGLISESFDFPGHNAIANGGDGLTGFDFSLPDGDTDAFFYVLSDPSDSETGGFSGYVSQPSLVKVG